MSIIHLSASRLYKKLIVAEEPDFWYKGTGKIASKMYTIILKMATNKSK